MMSENSVDKSLLAFLNGISKRIYFGESDITDDFLKSEVLGPLGLSEEGKNDQKSLFMFRIVQCCSQL